ncbi:MAG: hypothetical protein WAK60_11135 [Sedimentisphaerales bacterium]
MKGKIWSIIALVGILLVVLVAFNSCKKSTPTKQAKPATQTKVVEPNKPKK